MADCGFQLVFSLGPKEQEDSHQGVLNENEELYDHAIDCYRTALKHNPHSLDALAHLAHIFKVQKQYPNAVMSYNQYLSLRPQDGEAWMNLGECLLALQELNKAHLCLKNANKLLKQVCPSASVVSILCPPAHQIETTREQN